MISPFQLYNSDVDGLLFSETDIEIEIANPLGRHQRHFVFNAYLPALQNGRSFDFGIGRKQKGGKKYNCSHVNGVGVVSHFKKHVRFNDTPEYLCTDAEESAWCNNKMCTRSCLKKSM